MSKSPIPINVNNVLHLKAVYSITREFNRLFKLSRYQQTLMSMRWYREDTFLRGAKVFN